MTYPFVPSYVRLGMAKGPRRAFLVHMAEGGGTVGFLAKANRYGVSVHFVIEYSGRIVQMLTLGEMHSSIRPTAIRTTNDADGFFGAAAALAVMGDWARTDKTLGPNHASIAVELEGFAATGPNAKQAAALAALWADMRGRYPTIHALGHRDFASYKACPGKLIRWDLIGGHALEGEDMAFTVPASPLVAVIPQGGWIYDNEACAASAGNVQINPGPRRMPVAGKLANGNWLIGYVDATPTEAQLPVRYAKAGTTVEPAVTAAPPPVQLPPVELPPSESACKPFSDAAKLAGIAAGVEQEAERMRGVLGL